MDPSHGDHRFLLSETHLGSISVHDLSPWGAAATSKAAVCRATLPSRTSPASRNVAGQGATAAATLNWRSQQLRRCDRHRAGHTSAVASARWYPADSGAFVTVSSDGRMLVRDTAEMVPVACVERYPRSDDAATTVTTPRGYGNLHRPLGTGRDGPFRGCDPEPLPLATMEL
jgi:hypothetical protein